MRKLCFLKFDINNSRFQVFEEQEWDMNYIPRIGEKIVFNIDSMATIFEVVDVHYSAQGYADVIIGNEMLYTEYKKKIDSDYLAKISRM